MFVFIFCSFAWIFFRADNINDAYYILSHMFLGIDLPILYLQQGINNIGLDKYSMARIFFVLVILFVYDYSSLSEDVIEKISQKKAYVRYLFYFGIITMILFLRARSEADFVYFQF